MLALGICYPLELAMPDDADSLVDRVLGGEEGAWAELWRSIEPRLARTLRQPSFLGALSGREDDCRNVMVAVMERLRADDHARLRLYAERRRERPGLTFMPWLLVVAKRVAIDYMRAHDEYIDRRRVADASSPGKWRALETLIADSHAPGARPSFTDRALLGEVLAEARELPAAQQAALAAWLEGRDFAEIAAAQALGGAGDAERLVRAALQTLRRRFRAEGTR